MRGILTLSAVLAMLLAVVAGPVGAVQYGTVDTEDGWNGVGLVVFYDGSEQPDPNFPDLWYQDFGNALWRCTGSLIAEDVFLTAGHCAEDFTAMRAAIWFDVGPIAFEPTNGYPNPSSADATGTPYSHPSWTGALTIPNTSDVGAVALDQPVDDRETYDLAPVGYLDELATRRGRQDVTFTVVGYGLQSVKPVVSGDRTRYVGEVMLVDLRSALTDGWNLHYSSNPGKAHSGGTCFGDSGGPVFHDGGSGPVIVGVNSFVLNLNCKGSAFAYRVDTAYAQDFLDGISTP